MSFLKNKLSVKNLQSNLLNLLENLLSLFVNNEYHKYNRGCLFNIAFNSIFTKLSKPIKLAKLEQATELTIL